MSRFSFSTAVVTPPRFVTSLGPVWFSLAVAILALSAAGSHARTETPEEVDKILAFLEAENCDIIRDAMGEKKLSMEGSNFVVEASCADEKSYTFTLDPNFKVVGKKVIEN